MPAAAPTVGQPAPPDAQHQQRAEDRRGDREGQTDHQGHVEAGQPAAASSERHDAGHAARRAGSRGPSPAAGRSTSVESTPGDAVSSPDDVDRNAANAPAATSAPSSWPAGRRRAPRRAAPARRRRCRRSAAAAACRPGRARRRAVGKQVEHADQAEHDQRGAAGGARRRGWCRSGPARAAGPSCRGRSPGSASRSRRARRSPSPAAAAASRAVVGGDPGHLRHRGAGREVDRLPAATCGARLPGSAPSTASTGRRRRLGVGARPRPWSRPGRSARRARSARRPAVGLPVQHQEDRRHGERGELQPVLEGLHEGDRPHAAERHVAR